MNQKTSSDDNTVFYVGANVETNSGLTKGRVENISDEGNLDIVAANGYRYRNCMPFAWRLSSEPITSPVSSSLKRGDLCHIYYSLDGKIWHRNGYVIAVRMSELFVMFDDLDSHWISKDYCVKGHGDNPL